MTVPTQKILILCREWPLHWARHYVAAFRECCDVLTAGPGLKVEVLAEHDSQHTERWNTPNNIPTDADTLAEILLLLPPGWTPDLIVTIQSSGPAIRDIARAPCPTVYLSIDSWHDPEEFRYALPYDFVFVAQRALVPYFRECGCRHAEWLPLACNPAEHHPVDTSPSVDFSFVGMMVYTVNRQRVARLLRLEERFAIRLLSGLGGDAYCAALSEGRAIFNSSVAQDLNMRVFEAMVIGRPLLTNRDSAINGLDDLFEEGTHYLGYDDDDLMTQAERLMTDADLRQRLAHNAREAVLAAHTYRHRIDFMLESVASMPPPAAESDGLSSLLPRDTRHLLDVGLGMDRSRVALRKQGVQTTTGMLLPNQAPTRAGSFDAIVPWLATLEQAPDVISCGVPLTGEALNALADYAHGALAPGGALVLLVSAQAAVEYGVHADAAQWESWGAGQGFHLIDLHSRGDGLLSLHLRRYGRAFLDIAAEMYQHFPGGGV